MKSETRTAIILAVLLALSIGLFQLARFGMTGRTESASAGAAGGSAAVQNVPDQRSGQVPVETGTGITAYRIEMPGDSGPGPGRRNGTYGS